MGTDDLPHSTPSAEGVHAAGVERFLDAIEDGSQGELHSLILLRHGKVIAEGWWSPFSAERVHLLYSLSKTFTATAAGFAVAEGLVDLDKTVLSYFPELEAEITDPGSRAIKVRHVAAMASGHLAETVTQAIRNDPSDLVRGFLLIPPDQEPGSLFAYNQPCTYTLAAIVQRQSGQSLVDYLRSRLFEPLGIRAAGWIEQPPGRSIGYSGLHTTTDAIARLGQLYLQRGRWGDRQLLAPAWVDEAARRQVTTRNEPYPDWQQGYGFQFWMSRHGYRGDGAFGQFCLVLPQQDMVIAITAATEQMQTVLDAIWAHVLPALDLPRPDPTAGRRLADRLAALALGRVTAAAEPDDRGVWDGATFVARPSQPEGAAAAPGPVGPVITEAALRASDGGWLLSLRDAGGRLETRVGADEWTVGDCNGVPVAVSGGWADSKTFLADVIFLETPHRLRISCSASDSTLTSHWPTVPLHASSLLQLRAP